MSSLEILTPHSWYAGIELHSEQEDEEDAEMSIKERVLSQVVKVIRLNKRPIEMEERKSQSASKCIYFVRAISWSHSATLNLMHFLIFTCPLNVCVPGTVHQGLTQYNAER